MNTSENAIILIKHYEGFRAVAYYCSASKLTIGYGTRIYPDGSPVKIGDRISKEKATECLWWDVRSIEKELNAMLEVNLTQYQFDALVSFCYNCGCNALRTSTLLKVINTHRTDIPIETAFVMWNKEDGSRDGIDNDEDGLIDEKGEKRKSKGLDNRRRSEAHLFLHNELLYYN